MVCFFFSPPPVCQRKEGGRPQTYEDAEAFSVGGVGFLAEEPDGDAGGDADEASVEADGTDCLFVHSDLTFLSL